MIKRISSEKTKLLIALGIIVIAIIGLSFSNSGSRVISENKEPVKEQSKEPEQEKKSDQEVQAPSLSLTELYQVNRVIDGDTIDVNMNNKVERLRLIGIDTPETVDPRKPVQCFGKEASNKAKELFDGKKVRLEADTTQGERDKYNRLLRYVFMEDGTNFNKWMIENGYAHEYTYNLPYKYQTDFKKAEKEARENNKGLWSPVACNGLT